MGKGVCLKLHSSLTDNSLDTGRSFISIENQTALAPLVLLAQQGVVIQFHIKNDNSVSHVGSLIQR